MEQAPRCEPAIRSSLLSGGFIVLAVIAVLICAAVSARAADGKPNILVIWGDDIGRDNISAYSLGMMGYHTPNIDRLAKEGALFTDSYAQQSCTAGRASFILGQHPFRTGLLTIGMPGSPQGIPDWAPTIADLLKNQGYATGQFGKNHLGDRDSHLPTVHGFDEFLGNLYHLNAEEEPETYYYPKDPEFRKKFGPRGVIHAWSDGKGGQRIEDTGPLTRARMPTVDLEIYDAANKFIDSAVTGKKPFFVWFNTTRMHVWTHLKPSAEGRTGIGALPRRHGGARRHGRRPARSGSTNSASPTTPSWFTAPTTARRKRPGRTAGQCHSEARRAPPGKAAFACRCSSAGRASSSRAPSSIEIFSQEDWLPTLLAAAGEPDIVEKLEEGYEANGKTWKVHADGYNFLPFFKGEATKGPREEIYYFGQGGDLNAIRWNDWKVSFATEDGNIATAVRNVPGWPVITNLRADPYERASSQSGMYIRWYGDNIWLFVPVQEKLKAFLVHVAGISVPAGKQPERRGHQLQFPSGDTGHETAKGDGIPFVAEQLARGRNARCRHVYADRTAFGARRVPLLS